MKSHRAFIFVGVPLAVALFSGCKKNEDVQVYRVSKAQQEAAAAASQAAQQAPAPESPGMSGMPGMNGPGGLPPGGGSPQQPAQFASNPPPNWEPQALSSMRQASFLVKGDNGATADISLVILAGSAGGVLDNVNRWLSQLGQPAISEDKLAQVGQHVAAPLGDVTVVDLEGLPQGGDVAKDGRIVGGIASAGGTTVFFKMRGNAALAESQKEAFIKWINTVQMAESTANLPAPAAGAVPLPAAAPAPAAEPAKPQLKWEAPEGWKSIPPSSSMRYASFAVEGQNGEKADISVSIFGGNAGGDLQNVNRWRDQIGLQPVGESDLKSLVVPVKAKDGDILTVDMNGPKAHVLAGWANVGEGTWFFKLTGPDALAAGEKAKFMKFLESVQFHP